MVLNSGAVKVRGSVAYHQQQPWILNATIRENILFGESYNEARFQYVLHAAALDVDIASFPAGVDTEIGERGITLSGGQKARVSFARALYKNADTLLLDDPLSAVDSHTGAHLFFKGMKPAVKEHGKTIILVTHQVHVLPHCDVVVVIEDGKIAAMGSYAELEAAKINFHADEYEKDESDDEVESHNSYESYAEGKHNDDEPLPDMYGGTWASRNDRLESEDRDRHSTDDSEACTQTLTAEAIASLTAGSQKDQFGVAHSDVVNLSDVVAVGSDGSQPAQLVELMPSQSIDKAIPAPAAPLVTAKPKAKGLTEDSGKSLMTLEDREVGAVDSNVYMYYLVSGGWYIFVFLLIISLCGKAATLFATFWLGFWGKENVDAIIAGTELSVNRNLYYLNIYAALSLCNVVAATGRAYLASIHGIRTGHVIHNAMLKQIVGASVSFFDTTPLGR
jgi:ATP-binding cassette subfamily C (CFTR/MRP) protein 1